MAFDLGPGSTLPPDQDSTVIVTPINKTAGGQAYLGRPNDPDPAQTAAALTATAIKARDDLQAFHAQHPGLLGGGGAPGAAPAPAPAAPPALDAAAPTGAPATPAPPPAPAPAPAAPRPGHPGAQLPPAPGGAPLDALMAGATAPADPTGDAVDQELARAAAERPPAVPAKVGDLNASGQAIATAGGAQKAALTEAGVAEQATATAEAAARDKLARESDAKAAAQAAARAEAQAEIRTKREAAAKEPYHGFWETRSAGQQVLAGIGILLGGASFAAGHTNQALGVIDRAIAQDFNAQKEKHAQLWKDVEESMAQGQQLRADQLDDMSNFRTRQGQTLDAVIAKGKAMGAQSKNKEGIAALDAKSAQLAFERDKAYDEAERLKAAAKEAARHNRAEEGIQRAKIRAAGSGTRSKQDVAAEKFINAAVDKDEARLRGSSRSPGVLVRLESADAAAADLRQAIASGDPTAIKVAVMHVKEQSTRFLTGVAPSKMTMQMNEDLKGSPDELTAHLSKLMGNPTEGKKYAATMLRNIDGIRAQTLDVVDRERGDFVRKYHGPKGLASTTGKKDIVEGRGAGLFGGVKNPDGTPRYQEGGAGTAPAAAPGGLPPGAIKGSMGGKKGYVLNGQFTAL